MKIVFIVSTSVIGSYIVIRGFSFLFGNFPSESLIIDLIRKEEYEELKNIINGIVYVYLVFWIILSVGSAFVQFRINREVEDEDLHYKKNEEE